jgi:hypothetical protein
VTEFSVSYLRSLDFFPYPKAKLRVLNKKEEICKKRQKWRDQSERVSKKAKTCPNDIQIHVNSLFLLHWRGPYIFQKGGGGGDKYG